MIIDFLAGMIAGVVVTFPLFRSRIAHYRNRWKQALAIKETDELGTGESSWTVEQFFQKVHKLDLPGHKYDVISFRVCNKATKKVIEIRPHSGLLGIQPDSETLSDDLKRYREKAQEVARTLSAETQ